MLKAYVKELNEFFNNTAKRVANEITWNGLNITINTLSNDSKKNPFYIHELKTETDGVLKTIKSLKSDSHGSENFSIVKFAPALFEKIPSFVCLVFKKENKRVLKW